MVQNYVWFESIVDNTESLLKPSTEYMRTTLLRGTQRTLLIGFVLEN